MYYERDNYLSQAARVISDRIRALPEFAEAKELVIQSAIKDCHLKDVPQMRVLGGFSTVIRRHIDALGDRYRVNHGSKLYPSSVVDELRAIESILREAVSKGSQIRPMARDQVNEGSGWLNELRAAERLVQASSTQVPLPEQEIEVAAVASEGVIKDSAPKPPQSSAQDIIRQWVYKQTPSLDQK